MENREKAQSLPTTSTSQKKPRLGNTENPYTSRPSGQSCSACSTTTGGLLGGGLAAVLSKKDAYGWAVPLGAVLGMGVASTDC